MTQITVIVPVYEVEHYIDRCLESLVKQTFFDIEILLMYDVSSDNSLLKCQMWEKKDDRIKLFFKQKKGLGAARNEGLSLASADIVSFIDSDDYCDLNMLKYMYDSMKTHETDIVYCNWVEVNSESNLTKPKFAGGTQGIVNIQEHKNLIHRINPSACNKLFKKSLFIEHNLSFPDYNFEDLATIPFLVAKAKRISKVDKPLYYYEKGRPESITSSVSSAPYDIIYALENIIFLFKRAQEFENYYEPLLALTKKHFNYWLYLFKQSSENKDIIYSIKEFGEKIFKQHFINWEEDTYFNAIFFGSYNLRAICRNINNYNEQKIKHYMGTNIVSQMSPVIAPPDFKNKSFAWQMIQADFSKEFKTNIQSLSQDYEYLILDLLEERFDLIKYNNSYVTKSAYYDDYIKEVSNENVFHKESYQALWFEKCKEFISIIKQYFRPENVFLIKSKMNECFRGIDTVSNYENISEIKKLNLILNEYYDFFEESFEGIHVIELPQSQLHYTNQYHMYGCYPYHYNDAYYNDIADRISSFI